MSVVIKLQCLHQAYRHQGCMYSGEIGGGGGGGGGAASKILQMG